MSPSFTQSYPDGSPEPEGDFPVRAAEQIDFIEIGDDAECMKDEVKFAESDASILQERLSQAQEQIGFVRSELAQAGPERDCHESILQRIDALEALLRGLMRVLRKGDSEHAIERLREEMGKMKDVALALDQAPVEMRPGAEEVRRVKAELERSAQQLRCVNEWIKLVEDSRPVRYDRQIFARPPNR